MTQNLDENPLLTTERILGDYRLAVRSREVDEGERRLQTAGKAMFCILSGGQELAQIASIRPLEPGDWVRGYYRCGTEALALDVVSVREMFAQVLGTTEEGKDPASGGRMMGRHVGSRLIDEHGNPIDLTKQVNRASDVSSTGSQMPVAMGLARASRVFRDTPALAGHTHLSNGGKEVALVTIGDASMAEGVSYEAIAQAVVQRVPLVISALDNGYGISVPTDQQIPHGSISKALRGFGQSEGDEQGLKIIGPVEGWDYPTVTRAYKEAFQYARETGSPALVHVLVTQPFGHSSSGDHRRYKSPERLEWEGTHDCIAVMRDWIISNGHATEETLRAIEGEERDFVKAEEVAAWEEYLVPVRACGNQALTLARSLLQISPQGLNNKIAASVHKLEEYLAADFSYHKASPYFDIYAALSEIVLLTHTFIRTNKGSFPDLHMQYQRLRAFRDDIKSHMQSDYSSRVYAEGAKSPTMGETILPEYTESPKQDTGAHIIAGGLATIMAQDPRVVLYGEDAGRIGGVTTCSLGLQAGKTGVVPSIWEASPAIHRYVPEDGFGESRVWDHAIAEGTIIGSAVGLSLRGLNPVAELQYHDYVVWGLQQMVDEVSCLRHRTDGGQECPMLVRTHGHQLVGMWHSGSPMGMMLSSCPGLRVLVPRDAVQAVGMYRSVLQGGDPAFSVEPLASLYGKGNVPENLDKVTIPLGQSEVLREGSDATIITYGFCCDVALEAAKQLDALGINVEIVDLQTLNPLDLNGIALASMEKTGKVLFLDEDIPEGATAIIAKELLHKREGLLRVENCEFVTAPSHKPAYGRDGKSFGKPQPLDVVNGVLKLLDGTDNKKRLP